MMANKQPPKLLSENGHVKVNYHYHRKGWELLQSNLGIDHATFRLYETLLRMWNEWMFPQVMTFTKDNINSKGCPLSSGKYAKGMKELEAHGLIKDYRPGSKSGKQGYSSLKMVNLEPYYHSNKNPYLITVSSLQTPDQLNLKELEAITPDNPLYAFAQNAIKNLKLKPPAPEQYKKEPIDEKKEPEKEVSTPKVENKTLLSENDVMDLAQNLAKRAKELYREVHSINPQIDIDTGLKPEQEMSVSIDIVAYIIQKAGIANATEGEALLNEKMTQTISEEEKIFVAKLIEDRFLAHSAAKHGKDKADIEGINACFKQGQEVRDRCYLQMTEVLIKEYKITRWCELYWLINKANRLFYAAALDPKLKAEKMNPHAFAAFGKMFEYMKKNKKRKDFEKD